MAVNDRIAVYRVCLSQIALDEIEIRVGGVGKQRHGERQLRQKAQSVAAMLMRSKPNPSGPRTKPKTVNTIGPLIKGSIRADRYRSEEKPRRKRHFGTSGPNLPRKVRMDYE